MIEGFDEIVLAWEKHELFYKELYEKKKGNPAEYRRFLSQLNVEDLREEGLVVPDLYDTFEIYGETTPIFDLNTDIAVWKHSRYTPAYLHAHRYFEIVCVVSGHARHRVSGETVMELQPGDICILPDGVCHSLEVISDDGIVINVMLKKSTFQYTFFDILSSDNLLSRFFQDALLEHKENNYLFFRTGNEEEDTIECCIKAMFLNYYKHRKYYDKMIKHLVSCLFILLLRNYNKYYIPDKNSQKELKIMRYLQEHYADATLEHAAAYFNYSTSYFSRMVKHNTGCNFTELLVKYRLELACRLLRESRLKVGEICEIIGYHNLEHFNRQFRKEFDRTPTQYRREHRDNVKKDQN